MSDANTAQPPIGACIFNSLCLQVFLVMLPLAIHIVECFTYPPSENIQRVGTGQ